jgi:DNA-binding Lrp family transcriptional regulator
MTGRRNDLDTADTKLLGLLRENARTPLVALAKAIGLSRSSTQERMKKLERDGVIKSYTIQTCTPGDTEIRAWILLTLGQAVDCTPVVRQLKRMPAVMICHSLAGEVDILLFVRATSVDELSELREEIVAAHSVASAQTFLVLAEHLFDVGRIAGGLAGRTLSKTNDRASPESV